MGAAASMKHVYSDAMDWFKLVHKCNMSYYLHMFLICSCMVLVVF